MKKIIVFGEILFDNFIDSSILGGAPLNFAIWIKRLLLSSEVFMISSVGNDELGKKALELISQQNINTDFISINAKLKTGIANVFLDKFNNPDYEIVENVAFDDISCDKKCLETANSCDVFYCNMLSLRDDRSYNSFLQLLPNIKAKYIVFDMTLRKQFYSKNKLEKVLNFINILKVNEEEFLLIKTLFYKGLSLNEDELILKISKDFCINTICLTKGEKGASLFINDNFYHKIPDKNIKIVDTVGAGDSFCAALIYGLLMQYSVDDILNISFELAKNVIQHKGATPNLNLSKIKKIN